MLAVSANRTRLNFLHQHLCVTLGCLVDRHRLDECTHLKSTFKVAKFNEILASTKLYTID